MLAILMLSATAVSGQVSPPPPPPDNEGRIIAYPANQTGTKLTVPAELALGKDTNGYDSTAAWAKRKLAPLKDKINATVKLPNPPEPGKGFVPVDYYWDNLVKGNYDGQIILKYKDSQNIITETTTGIDFSVN
jgi:hypothetical protein